MAHPVNQLDVANALWGRDLFVWGGLPCCRPLAVLPAADATPRDCLT